MKTISILGSGWLGLPLVRTFLAMNYAVKASTTSAQRLPELRRAGAEPFLVDIDALADGVADFLRADVLIVNIPSKNVDGFRELLRRIEDAAVKNLLFVSSTSVYPAEDGTYTETGAAAGSPLLAIENLFAQSASFRSTVVRFGGLIGYGRHPGRFFRAGKVVQNPDSPVNLIPRDDCVGIVSRIVERGIWGEVFNGCADTHPTKRAFYSRAARSIGAEPPAFAASSPVSRRIVSNEKVKQVLNYEFIHPDLMRIDFAADE